MGYLNNAGLSRFWNAIKGMFVRTVNGVSPDANGNVQVSGGGGSALGNRGIFYGTCSTVAATTEKAVTCSDFTANDLVAGSVVMVLFSVTNSGAVASLTLNVNSTGAKSIKYISNGSYANIPAVGYLKANQIYQFTFDGTYWVVEMNYDTNNNAYRSYMADAKLKTYTNLYRYMLCFTRDEQHILPVNAVDNTVGTSKTLTTAEFDPFGPIWYYNSTTTVNASNVAGSLYYFCNTVDLRYSFNTAKTLTASKNVYIVCDPQSNGKVKLSSNPISQTLPSTEDGKVYILLGTAYDTYRVSIHTVHPIYYYSDGVIRMWNKGEDIFIKKSSFENAGITDKTYDSICGGSDFRPSITAPHSYPYATLTTYPDKSLTPGKMYRVVINDVEYEVPSYNATVTFADSSMVENILFIGNPGYFDGTIELTGMITDIIGQYWDVPFLITDAVLNSTSTGCVRSGPYIFRRTGGTITSVNVSEITYSGALIPKYLIDGNSQSVVLVNESAVKSVSIGSNRIPKDTSGSIAVGVGNKITGLYASAIGTGNEASAYGIAIGVFAKANNYYAISLGWKTNASGAASLATGAQTTASGNQSTAIGNRTIANHKSQLAFGEFNEADPSSAAASARGNYVEIVGNGSDANSRSNARMLGWDGHEYLKGGLTLGYGTNDETYLSPSALAGLLSGGGSSNLEIITCSPTWNNGVGTATLTGVTESEIRAAITSGTKNYILYVSSPGGRLVLNVSIVDDYVYLSSGIIAYAPSYYKWYDGEIFDDNNTTVVNITERTVPSYSGLIKMHVLPVTVTWSGSNYGEGNLTAIARSTIINNISAGTDLYVITFRDSNGDLRMLNYASDDTADSYWSSSPIDEGNNEMSYYMATFNDYDTPNFTVEKVSKYLVPTGGTTGQVLTRTANGLDWQSLPTYNGGVS